MELLDLDETEIPLDQLECGSDRGDFGDSINSYLKDMSPLRGDGPGDVSQFEGNDYSALLQEVTNHLQRESQENENGIEDYGDEDYEDGDYEDEDYGDEDYGDEGGEYGGAEPGPDEDDDMFAEYEEDMRNSKAERALSRGPEGSDNVRLEASHESYSSDGEDDDGIAVVAAHNGHSLRSPTGDAAADESYADDYEDEDDCEIDYAASPVRSGGHVHAGYGIAATGALAGSIGGTGLFSPTKIKHLLDKEADEDENDESPEAKNAQWSSHSRSKTIDRSKFNPEPGQPDSRGAEVVFSASSYGAEGYGDDGANPVFTYKDFEFLPSAEEETGRLQRAQLKEIRRRQQQQQALPRGGRKIVINQGPSAPPKIKKAGPYAQEKLGAPPGVQRKKKGQPVDPAQARKQRENREKHKVTNVYIIYSSDLIMLSGDLQLMLEMIALKRKEQEDEAIRQVLREEAKRKRFKEVRPLILTARCCREHNYI